MVKIPRAGAAKAASNVVKFPRTAEEAAENYIAEEQKKPRVPRAQKPKKTDEQIVSEAMVDAEVGGEVVRETVMTFLRNKNERIKELLLWHEAYNAEYFEGKLSRPLITIEHTPGSKALATYFFEHQGIGIPFHIRLNLAFIALCWNEKHIFRIENTLKHEMIHQWQHECVYVGDKKVPKSLHNKVFKEKAAEIGIPCVGRNMSTGTSLKEIAAEQNGELENLEPEEQAAVPKKSRNRKWQCGCGDSRTVWSTKEVKAVCGECKKPYEEK